MTGETNQKGTIGKKVERASRVDHRRRTALNLSWVLLKREGGYKKRSKPPRRNGIEQLIEKS